MIFVVIAWISMIFMFFHYSQMDFYDFHKFRYSCIDLFDFHDLHYSQMEFYYFHDFQKYRMDSKNKYFHNYFIGFYEFHDL